MVDMLPDGRVQMSAERRSGKISDVFGLLKNKTDRQLSIDEIKELAARGWAGRR